MGKHGWQSISRWESDNQAQEPPGPVMVAVKLMLAAQRIEARRAGTTKIGPVEDESRVANGDAPNP